MVAIRFTGIISTDINIMYSKCFCAFVEFSTSNFQDGRRSFSLSEHVSQDRLEIFFEIQRARGVQTASPTIKLEDS